MSDVEVTVISKEESQDAFEAVTPEMVQREKAIPPSLGKAPERAGAIQRRGVRACRQ